MYATGFWSTNLSLVNFFLYSSMVEVLLRYDSFEWCRILSKHDVELCLDRPDTASVWALSHRLHCHQHKHHC